MRTGQNSTKWWATLVVTAVGVTLAAPAAQAAEAPAAPSVEDALVINETQSSDPSDGPDWIELTNTSDQPVDPNGVVVLDNKDTDPYTITGKDPIAPGGHLLLSKDADFGFGLGKGDSVRLFSASTTDFSGTTPFDATTWPADTHTDPSWGRCPDGTGEFAMTGAATPGATNDCSEPTPEVVLVEDALVINETQSSDPSDAPDWIELTNTSDQPVDPNGVVVLDNKDTDPYTITGKDPIAPGGHLLLSKDADFGFGLGKGDSVRLFSASTTDFSGTTPFDATTWPADTHTDPSWGRCPDGTGEFAMTGAATPGATNDCVVTEPEPGTGGIIVINEVESNGDDTDWVEVMNIGTDSADISGYVMMDNKDRDAYTLPQGSIVPAGSVFVIDQETTASAGFTFGLGDPDEVRLFAADGTSPVANFAYDSHAAVTWARCPNGTGDFVDSSVSTKGELNDCSTPIRINEIESSDANDGADWIELINISDAPVDITGLILSDNKDEDVFSIPATPALAAGAIVVFERTDDSATGFDYGLGGGDNVRLFESDGVTLIDSYEWNEHAATTFGRCPDGTGEFVATAQPTPGAANICAGIVNAQAWPGGADVSTVDAMDTYAGDMSGIDYDASTGSLWAVQNGDGLLYRIVQDGSGNWVPDATDGWADGKTLRYPGGTGTVDAEGVTVTGAGASAGVYVSSERNNDSSSTSRPSVLKYDVSGSGTTLTASTEWNLAADFPGIGANAGMEGITYIPDSWLTARGFLDQNTSTAYSPADYAGHGDGLFFVSIEGTAGVYAYALMTGGAFERVAELDLSSLSFSNVADVQFDADRDLLWVVCDDACDGRIATFELSGEGDSAGVFTASALYERPAGMANVANEGFAIADAATCTDGSVATFYVDDANTDGFSIRTGTLDCAGGTDGGTDGGDSGSGDGGDAGAGEGDGGEATGPGQSLECVVTAPASATPGQAIAVTVDPDCSGSTVSVYMFSEPTFVGTFAVPANGVVSFTVPASLPAGTHTIVLQLADGTVVGSTTITLTEVAPAGDTVTVATGELSDTGAPVDGTILLTVMLLLSGAALVLARRKAASV
ncbi:lamin tail domain-containing protein [Demequina aurantiaca]|uniref:lamin tail domain-containing protein n=1 Tax=Demequina aurantiaca TaxID=676200 RepID=UPI003D33A383